MSWKLNTAQRIRVGAALIVVFLLVLATNMIDSSHFEIVRKSLTTVYEDRLIAKDYIYKISRQLQVKKNASESSELSSREVDLVNQTANDSIESLLTKFGTTRLTDTEARHFESLKNRLGTLYQLEKKKRDNPIDNEPSANAGLDAIYTIIFEDLDRLSQIQLDEGKREVALSTRAIGTSDLISKLEIGFLIVIGVLIQLLIFLKPLR